MTKSLIKYKFRTLALTLILATNFCAINLVTTNSYAETNLNKDGILNTIKTGKVISKNLDIKSGPSTLYKSVGKLKKDYTFKILNPRSYPNISIRKLDDLKSNSNVEIIKENENSWYKIKYKNTCGYVSSDSITASLDGFLFVGDSYTAFMKDIINSNTKNHYIVAKSGVVPSYWLDNFSKMPDSSKIKGATILLGVNGIKAHKYDETLKDMKTLLSKLSSKYSDKKIYVQRVHPLGKNFSRNIINDITKYNKEIENFCKTKSNLIVIDSSEGLVTTDGYLKYPDWEGIHHLPSKYETYYNNISQAILDTN